jgi:hypothetical protein
VVDFVQSALSVPRTKTSTFPALWDTAAGLADRTPPRDVHDDQLVPSQCFHKRALSVPCTKTSRLFAFCAHVAGLVPEASCPPTLDQESPGPVVGVGVAVIVTVAGRALPQQLFSCHVCVIVLVVCKFLYELIYFEVITVHGTMNVLLQSE